MVGLASAFLGNIFYHVGYITSRLRAVEIANQQHPLRYSQSWQSTESAGIVVLIIVPALARLSFLIIAYGYTRTAFPSEIDK